MMVHRGGAAMPAWWETIMWRWRHRRCTVTHSRVRASDSLAGMTGWWCIDHQQGRGRMRGHG